MVDAVFAGDVMATARNFLRQDGALQQEHRDSLRRDAADQQRRQRIQIVSQFQREHQRCERRAHGAPHHRRHADHRP